MNNCNPYARHALQVGYFCNPITGRWNKESKRARIRAGFNPENINSQLTVNNLSSRTSQRCNAAARNARNPNYICNPVSKRWVKRSGRIGKTLTTATKRKKTIN